MSLQGVKQNHKNVELIQQKAGKRIMQTNNRWKKWKQTAG